MISDAEDGPCGDSGSTTIHLCLCSTEASRSRLWSHNPLSLRKLHLRTTNVFFQLGFDRKMVVARIYFSFRSVGVIGVGEKNMVSTGG